MVITNKYWRLYTSQIGIYTKYETLPLSFTGPATFDKNVDIGTTLNTGGNITSGGSVIDAGGNTNHHSH